MRIALVAFDDFTDLDLFLAWDLMKRVPGLDVRIVAPAPRIRSSTGIEIAAHGGYDEVASADGVYVTSGRGSRGLARDAATLATLSIDPARQVVAAVDSGVLVLAALGLLRGRRATTYPAADLHAALADLGVTLVPEALVVDGGIATAAQCLAGVDLVGWFLGRLAGTEAAARSIASVRRLGARPAPAFERASLTGTDAEILIGELDAEILALYPEDETACHFRLDADEVAPGRGAFLVAREDGVAVACGAIRRLDATTAEIKRMYTRPAARGRGLARDLLAALEGVAAELGAHRVVLETGPRQPAAIALYRRAGYVPIGPFGEYTAHPLSLFFAKVLS